MNFKLGLLVLLISIILLSCSAENNKNQIVVGIPPDVESLNPLYAFSALESHITELLYLSLVNSTWNSEKGDIEYSPMLAGSWEWNIDENYIVIELSNNAFWSDGIKCSVDDIIFSFDIYSDPKVKSIALGYFENFNTDEDGHIDLSKTFEKVDDNKLKIKFKKGAKPQIADLDHLILPKHFWSKFKREEISTINMDSLVTNGAFNLDAWEKDQAIILKKNTESVLVSNETINLIIFKIIPEYQNRMSQLKKGDIDLMEYVKSDDIASLDKIPFITISPITGREFDYIGWNNISPDAYKKNKIVPHNLFGSPAVRRALTLAINREVVVDEYLNGFGEVASTPVSKIFTSIYDSTITELSFNQELAMSILKAEGWIDRNGDGTIDKSGKEFSFVMHIPAGNPRREFAAALFQNNLSAIGIDMTIESNELGYFIDNLFAKQFDSWMAAWGVPIPTNLKISWYSDLDQTPLNFSSFQNVEIDKLLDKLEIVSGQEEVKVYQEIQKILSENQPYSFLYWINNIACYNNKIENISNSPLGTIKNCWEWKLKK
jgi:peptide/nickel transport system substrate-binding protein